MFLLPFGPAIFPLLAVEVDDPEPDSMGREGNVVLGVLSPPAINNRKISRSIVEAIRRGGHL